MEELPPPAGPPAGTRIAQPHSGTIQHGDRCNEKHCRGSVRKKLTASALSTELLRLGLQPIVAGNKGPGQDDEDSGNGCLSANFITAALNCQTWVVADSACMEMLLELEAGYGTKSPFHRMTVLNCLAMKATSASSRQWSLATICDWIAHGLLKCSDVTKATLVGDKHHAGLIPLYETKLKALSV